MLSDGGAHASPDITMLTRILSDVEGLYAAPPLHAVSRPGIALPKLAAVLARRSAGRGDSGTVPGGGSIPGGGRCVGLTWARAREPPRGDGGAAPRPARPIFAPGLIGAPPWPGKQRFLSLLGEDRNLARIRAAREARGDSVGASVALDDPPSFTCDRGEVKESGVMRGDSERGDMPSETVGRGEANESGSSFRARSAPSSLRASSSACPSTKAVELPAIMHCARGVALDRALA